MSETEDSLKRRIATHYDTCSPYYFDLWVSTFTMVIGSQERKLKMKHKYN